MHDAARVGVGDRLRDEPAESCRDCGAGLV